MGDQALEKVSSNFRIEADDKGKWSNWIVRRFEVDETIGRPYQGFVDVVANVDELDCASLVGRSCALDLKRGKEWTRSFTGLIFRVENRGVRGSRTIVRIEFAAALQALAYGRNSRVFEMMTAPKIVEAVMNEGLKPFGRKVEIKTSNTYKKREYCVQYQESDLAFVRRLMIEEGIFFFFEQTGKSESDNEKIFLIDTNDSCPKIETMEDPNAVIAAMEKARQEAKDAALGDDDIPPAEIVPIRGNGPEPLPPIDDGEIPPAEIVPIRGENPADAIAAKAEVPKPEVPSAENVAKAPESSPSLIDKAKAAVAKVKESAGTINSLVGGVESAKNAVKGAKTLADAMKSKDIIGAATAAMGAVSGVAGVAATGFGVAMSVKAKMDTAKATAAAGKNLAEDPKGAVANQAGEKLEESKKNLAAENLPPSVEKSPEKAAEKASEAKQKVEDLDYQGS